MHDHSDTLDVIDTSDARIAVVSDFYEVNMIRRALQDR